MLSCALHCIAWWFCLKTEDPLLCSSCYILLMSSCWLVATSTYPLLKSIFCSMAELAIILLSTTCCPSSHRCRVILSNLANLFCRAWRTEHLPVCRLLWRLRKLSSGPCTLLSLPQRDSERSPRRLSSNPLSEVSTYSGVAIHIHGMSIFLLGTRLLRNDTESQFAVAPRPRSTDCWQFLIHSKTAVGYSILIRRRPCNRTGIIRLILHLFLITNGTKIIASVKSSRVCFSFHRLLPWATMNISSGIRQTWNSVRSFFFGANRITQLSIHWLRIANVLC